ncbi:serine/threonine-protein kinase [Amycolatopsis pithecellobii]|uniref:non-specific serine/threonine protein kinase n=1 Tax=Amycolatopsis pithecellobii TaxID=664692 RepID=A0A6N7YVG8_9PSEU|nr:serine/threonine-protein kinase [Amycolatopsis pithecellobii]MTD57065.1 protein kinase [Amycolatopsis pithecellobii]
MSACPRPGCAGRLDEAGFCDTCGLEAPPDTVGPATTGFAAPASISWSTPASASSRPGRSSGRSSSGNLLGRGVIDIPPVPRRDPRAAVLTDPQVPENKRFCSACGAKVGRGSEGKPGRVEGFCPRCGRRFSFTPKLVPGELLHDQYEVLGCLAHGGFGWIYLAADHRVADRWVVLKGLLDTGDTDAMAAAMAEAEFLARVEHPSIVRIYNFVEHRGTGYIVMEYVGGTSLRDLMKQAGEPAGCLPLTQAIAYTLEILPALAHLHASGMVYCDFKPDNAIQVEDQLKLIDLGAVRHWSDQASPIYGTPGYQAPEIGRELPSPVSDVYTVGRALAVMTFPFDFHHAYRDSLPPPSEVPLLAEYESFHRLLLRATHPDPDQRFGSAEEMRLQLEGVFREVASTVDGQPRAGVSAEFTPERRAFGVPDLPAPEEVAAGLPVPRVDLTDPGTAFLAGLAETDPEAIIRELSGAAVPGAEIRLRLARAQLDAGKPADARKTLNTTKLGTGDWRAEWYRGLAALAEGRPHQARQSFETVYDLAPGELAPKLAIAACAEAVGENADWYYRTVWRTDRTFISAAFGLARVLRDSDDRAGAAEVLESVPETSSNHVAAQLAAIGLRTGAGSLSEEDLVTAGARLSGLDLDEYRRAPASRDLLAAALDWVHRNGTGNGSVLGYRLAEHELRRGLEKEYLCLARQATARRDRIALVDEANRIRPRTWF